MAAYTRNISETILLTDSIGQIYDTHTFYDDHTFYNSTGTSNIARVLGWNRNPSETISVADYIADSVSIMALLVDTIFVDDSFMQTVSFGRFVSDSVLLQEYLQSSIQYFRSNSDVLQVQDTITSLISIAVKLYDSVMVNDNANYNLAKYLFLQDNVNLTDYFSYVNLQDVDNDTPPTIDVLIFTPMPYTQPDRVIMYATDEAPTIVMENFVSGGERVLKQYDSHTIYNKHIPYYDSIGTDEAPTILMVTDRP